MCLAVWWIVTLIRNLSDKLLLCCFNSSRNHQGSAIHSIKLGSASHQTTQIDIIYDPRWNSTWKSARNCFHFIIAHFNESNIRKLQMKFDEPIFSCMKKMRSFWRTQIKPSKSELKSARYLQSLKTGKRNCVLVSCAFLYVFQLLNSLCRFHYNKIWLHYDIEFGVICGKWVDKFDALGCEWRNKRKKRKFNFIPFEFF